MVAAAKLAVRLGECDESVLHRSKAILERAGLPTSCTDKKVTLEKILSSMSRDKKFCNGKNLFVLATKIGFSTQKAGIDKGLVEEVVRSCLD
jgi:3-dehydroquinate synthetase